MRRTLAVFGAAVLAIVFVAHVRAQAQFAQAKDKKAAFQGYWMGVDPVDGGDSRRSLIQQADGTYALAGRDTVFTLCDGTDRGFASFSDGTVVSRNVMESSALTIHCFNNNATVVLHVRFELVQDGLMLETTSRQDGTVFSTIVFHKVSVN